MQARNYYEDNTDRVCEEILNFGHDILDHLGFGHNMIDIRSKIEQVPRTNHFMHLFCGARSLDRELWRKCLVGLSCDIEVDSTTMDILTPVGKAVVLLGLLTIVPAGLLCGGPACTSWVFIRRYATGRTLTKPEGPRSKTNLVKHGNDMCAFITKITKIAYLRGLHWWWEQPISSLFFKMTCWANLITWVKFNFKREPGYVTFPMMSYGSDSKKPTKLLGDWGPLHQLHRRREVAKKAKVDLSYGTKKGRFGTNRPLHLCCSHPT
eukprot:833567-Pyramimonas_sp.AAC.1